MAPTGPAGAHPPGNTRQRWGGSGGGEGGVCARARVVCVRARARSSGVGRGEMAAATGWGLGPPTCRCCGAGAGRGLPAYGLGGRGKVGSGGCCWSCRSGLVSSPSFPSAAGVCPPLDTGAVAARGGAGRGCQLRAAFNFCKSRVWRLGVYLNGLRRPESAALMAAVDAGACCGSPCPSRCKAGPLQ